MTGDTQTLTARWVFPACGPPLERGTVTIDGEHILAVEPHGTRTADLDLGNAALIPGLVNAHTHLDLSGARGLIPPTTPDHFTDWLRGVIAYRRARTPEQTRADTRAGLAECLRFGTTLIGDIAAEGQSWDALAAAPTRAVVFHEIIGLRDGSLMPLFKTIYDWKQSELRASGGRQPPDSMSHPNQNQGADAPRSPGFQTSTCRPALSPHAPYSVRHTAIQLACNSGLPVAIHWAESPGEVELIEHHTGPFVAFLQELGVWDERQLISSFHRALGHSGLHAPQLLLVHANYFSPDGGLFRPNTTVVYCPRTHAAFGHPPHPFRDFLARGVRVCLGTDGLASNPDLDILAEARFVHARYPDFPGDTLLKMVTHFGAEALGWANETGSLEPGKSADLVAVPLPDRDAADPHELLFAADAPIGERRTLFRGQWR